MRACEVIRAIQKAGGQQTRQVGSHRRFCVEYTKADGSSATAFTTVPDHGGDIPIGTLASIEKAAGTGSEEGMAQGMTTYNVHVTREGEQWLADVPELEGTQTYAPNLTALDRYVREIIVLAADLPASAVADLALNWSYDVGDQLVQQANALRAERAELAVKEKQLEQATRELAAKLTRELGLSVRDAGPLLGISHQRVSQLRPADKSSRSAMSAKKARKATSKVAAATSRRHTAG
jgi:predicted RNA binding protein YcfA (HicA-like mRNA interferase family)/predicted transcriptional regulator